MRVYISSTYEDLAEHRAMAAQTLRQLGHDVVQMEDYVAETSMPLEVVLSHVADCDVIVSIVAWRYGYVPKEGTDPKIKDAKFGKTSITEYEYRQALAEGKKTLAFLIDERATWPTHFIDGIGNTDRPEPMRSFRSMLKTSHIVSFFDTPDSLGRKLAAAITSTKLRREVEDQRVDVAGGIDVFTENAFLTDSATMPIVELARLSQAPLAVTIDLKNPWWSTRLYLLAAIGQTMWSLQRIIVLEKKRFAGMVSAASARRVLRGLHKEADRFETSVLSKSQGTDIQQIVDHYLAGWNKVLRAKFEDEQPAEARIAQSVSVSNLRLWLGEAFVEKPIVLDDLKALSSIDILRILDYPNDFVPVVEKSVNPEQTESFNLVDKRALSDRLARDSVAEVVDRLGAY